jgi:phosphoribosyl-ATP pyrophosphohydrolase/phosphoribosyl-AMP cyclohydrolase
MNVTYGSGGLAPAIVQDADTARVLMLGYVNPASLAATQRTGLVHFWSRSRDRLWKKGETSGNTLTVVDISADCDEDAILIRARPAGPTCHRGTTSCFGGLPHGDDPKPEIDLRPLWSTILGRRADRPEGSYTALLLDSGVDGCARKVVEESAEVAFAAKDHATGTGPASHVAEEAADLIYHLLVLLAEREVDLADVMTVLAKRA